MKDSRNGDSANSREDIEIELSDSNRFSSDVESPTASSKPILENNNDDAAAIAGETVEQVGAVAGEVETAIADAKKALAEGGVEKMNEAFNQLQTSSHKMAEALYQQTAATGTETPAEDDQASAAGASGAGASGEDNVIDAEYVDVDENK